MQLFSSSSDSAAVLKIRVKESSDSLLQRMTESRHVIGMVDVEIVRVVQKCLKADEGMPLEGVPHRHQLLKELKRITIHVPTLHH